MMKMNRYIIGIASLLFILTGCSSYSCDVHTLCMRDEIGNYIIKWETNPQIAGTVKIYVSDTPGKFDMSHPAIYAHIEDGVTRYVTQDNLSRRYFRLTFNDHCMTDVAARYSFMDHIQNFRDFGGYTTQKGKQMKWGMIYRSGRIGKLSDRDSLRMLSTGIKTLLDLRTEEEVAQAPIYFPGIQIIHLPIPRGNQEEILTRLRENTIRKGDGLLYMEDTYIRFVSKYTADFARVFPFLLDEKNYPILIHGDLGKDRTGFLASLLLTIVGVPHETVQTDYLDSNRYIDPSFMFGTVSSLSTDAQETMTVLLSVNESFLDAAYREIEKQYGSFENYVDEGLGLSAKKQEKLKDILLR